MPFSGGAPVPMEEPQMPVAQPIALDVDVQWLGAMPKREFERQESMRQEKMARHSFAWKVMRGEDVAEAGHFEVQPIHRYKDLVMRRAIGISGGFISARLFPDEARSIRVEPDNPKDDADCKRAMCVEAAFRDKLTTFFSDAQGYTADSMTGFGGALRVTVDTEYDDDAGGHRVHFRRKYYDLGDVVIDRAAPSWRQSFAVFAVRYSRDRLLALSQEERAQDGSLIRGPVFDRQQVEAVFLRHKYGLSDPGSAVMVAVKQDSDGGESGDGDVTDWYDCFEYVGDVYRDGELIAKRQVITSCGDICLRAGDDPDEERSWVMLGSEDGQLDDPYPDSKGWLVAMKETNTNLYGSWLAFSRSTETFGMLTFDTKEAATVLKWGKGFVHGPKAKIPDIFQEFKYTANSKPFQEVKAENTQAIMELIGVSDQAMLGNPVPNVSATAAAGYQQMAETRVSLDAKHYRPLFEEVLQMHYRLLLKHWDVEIVTLENGQRYRVTREDLANFEGRMVLTSVGSTIPNQQRLAVWERVKPRLDAAAQQGLVNPRELIALDLEISGIDPQSVKRLMAPPEAATPMQPEGVAGPQPAPQNVVQMPMQARPAPEAVGA